MKKFCWAIAAVAMAFAALAGAAENAARRRVVVFDCVVERSGGYEWSGAALSEYAAALVNSAPGFEAADREAVVRLMRRYGYGHNQKSPFEVKDKVRVNLGGSIVVEGVCNATGDEIRMKGSIVDLERGDIVSDMDFRVSPFDIFAAQKKLGEKLEKALGKKIANGQKLLLGTDSKEAYTHYRKGKSLFEMGVYEQAVEQLKLAVKKDDKFVAPYVALGQTMIETVNFGAAKENLEKAAKIAPSNFKAYFLLGVLSMLTRDREAAERHFLKAVSLNKDDPDSRYRLGELYYAERRTAEAEKQYLRAVEIDPDMPEGWYGLAVLYSVQRDEKKALEAVAKAVRTGGEAAQEKLRNDSDFAWLKTKKEFIWLVGKERD